MIKVYSVDLEVWSKLAKHARIMRISSKCAHDFDCDWQHVNAFSDYVTLIRSSTFANSLLLRSGTKVPGFVVMEHKCTSVIYVYEMIFLLYTSRSAEYSKT